MADAKVAIKFDPKQVNMLPIAQDDELYQYEQDEQTGEVVTYWTEQQANGLPFFAKLKAAIEEDLKG